MIYLLDTNACISYLNNAASPVRQRLQELGPTTVRVCSIVEAELRFGVEKSARRASNFLKLDRFLSAFNSLPFDSQAAHAYARIRHELSRAGTPIGPNDLMIAAIAITNQAILVTHNVREFSRVEGLRIEDWETQ